jgi:Ca-activated chloride channel family protein
MEIFQFEEIKYLYLAVLILFITGLFVYNKKALEAKLQKLGSYQQLLKQINPQSRLLKRSRQILIIFSLLFLIIALANPQLGSKKETVKRESIDLLLAVDISNSMLCEDLTPNRLERAKKLGLELVDKLKGNRIGLLFFAGNSYVQMPLTTDYSAFQTFLRAAKPELASTQGTEFAPIINLADQTFTKDKQTSRVLLILTDGEVHDENALEAAEEIAADGTRIYTVGFGSEEGAYIPIKINGRTDFKRDQEGNFVQSKINLPFLSELAQKGNGQLFPYSGDRSLAQTIANKLNELEKTEMEQRIYTDYYSYFQYFLGLAIALLAVEFLLRNKTSKD